MKSVYLTIYLGLLVICILSGSAEAQTLLKDKPYKKGDFLISVYNTMKMDFIEKGSPYKKIISMGDTIYDDDKYLILGNAVDVSGIYKKYINPYKFSMYHVPKYQGKLAPPDFKTDTAALLFRTQIKEQCKTKGINFAGHFTLVEWGCGSECLSFAIVDRLNGNINYSNMTIEQDEVFYTLGYKANSKLILLNDWKLRDHKGYISCYNDDYKLVAVEWHNNKIKKLSNN